MTHPDPPPDQALLLLEAARVAAVFLDAEGRVVSFTPAATEIFALRPEDLGRSLAEVSHHALAMPTLPPPASAGPASDRELVLRDGRRFLRRALPYHLVGTSRAGLALTFAEVTALSREGQERDAVDLRAMTDALPVLIGFVDREHRYQFHNETYVRWFGPSATDLRGRRVVDVLGEQAYAAVRERLDEALAGRAVTFEAEMPYRLGPARSVDISFVPYVAPSGQVTGVFTMVVDASERRRMAVELAETRHLAEQANRAKSAFLASMSHEMRTPLTAILGYLDLLSAHLVDADNLACVGLIRRNGQHLQRIIHDLLDLAKVEAGTLTLSPSTFAWRPVVEEVLTSLRPRALDKGLALEVRTHGSLPDTLTSDATRLRQILLNLIGNAVTFTSRGHVTLDVDWQSDLRHLRFRVSDSGIGMTPEQLARVQRPFLALGLEVSENPSGHPGLGLAISQHLAAMVGAGLALSSEPGSGTTVTFTVDPGRFDGVHWSSDDPESFAVPAGGRSTRLDGRRILLADDRREIRYLIQTFLEEAGAEVASVGDGLQACEAVAQAGTRGDPFAAVILDIEMPRLDGREAARNLRRDGYKGPLLALTAAAMKGEGARCLEAGFDAYLSKPVERVHLLGAIHDLLTRVPAEPSRATAAEAQPQEDDTTKEAAPGTGILVVDDDPDAAESLAALLEMEGHRVRTAPDGATALRLAMSEPPALVFLDLTFPHESGYEILASLRPILEKANGSAIALSGRDGYEEKQRALRAGFRAYLGKPVSIEVLLTTVDRLTAENRKGPPPGGSERPERRLSG